MFHYKKIEKILDISLVIKKHGNLVYGNSEQQTYDYEADIYLISSSRHLNDDELSLINIIIEKNETSQPFWVRVIKNLSFEDHEIPKGYKEISSYKVWLLQSKGLTDQLEILSALFEDSEIVTLNSDRILVIVHPNEELTPFTLLSHLESEAMISPYIYVGPTVETLKDLNHSFEQAVLLTKLNRRDDKKIIRFNEVVFERVLHDLDENSKSEILKQYLRIYPIQNLNEELIETIEGFFKHNLNVTDTATALFLHRNTLVYRLNKINQITNLDIRHFEDATRMKILLSLM